MSRSEYLAQYARDAFSTLRRASIYDSSAAVGVKRQITVDVWQSAADRLVADFNEAGWGRLRSKISGFGYFVEEFAKRSQVIPQNTPMAQHLMEMLLAELRTGDGAMTSLAEKLRNPDLLFISLQGRKANIWGMGEIKASVQAHLIRKDQLAGQEAAVRRIVEMFRAANKNSRTHKFFADKALQVAQDFRKFMIVPVGTKKSMAKVLPDWEVVEIEFSYEELLFLAQCLWPKFRTNVKFQCNALLELEEGFFQELLGWWVRKVGDEYPADALKDLLLFVCITGRCAGDDEDIALVRDLMQRKEIQDAWEDECDVQTLKSSLTTQENRFVQKFRETLRADEEQVFHFLAIIRTITIILAPLLSGNHGRVAAMPEVNLW